MLIMVPKHILSHNEYGVYDFSETKSIVTWFKNQFSDGFVTEFSSTTYYSFLLRKHTCFNFINGWQLKILKSNIMKHNNKTLYYKHCLGSAVYKNILGNGKKYILYFTLIF